MNIQTIKANYKLGIMDIGEIAWLIDTIEQYQLYEEILLTRLKQKNDQIHELKKHTRRLKCYELEKENLQLSMELACLKGELSG